VTAARRGPRWHCGAGEGLTIMHRGHTMAFYGQSGLQVCDARQVSLALSPAISGEMLRRFVARSNEHPNQLYFCSQARSSGLTTVI
jgi:hypothetical protein